MVDIAKIDKDIYRYTIANTLLVIRKLGKCTNNELSDALGYKPEFTSAIVKDMIKFRFVTTEKGLDAREVIIKLTTIGKGQADLAKLMSFITPERDEAAEAISKFADRFLKKFGLRGDL